MHPSLRVLSGSARKPLINFIGKRKWPSTPEAAHPHPAAPAELKKSFSDFVKKFEASMSTKSDSALPNKGQKVFQEFWEAPAQFWRPRVRELDEAEIEAISSGGASLR